MSKTQQLVSIPEPLREFLRQVQRRIDSRDKATIAESDDRIQSHLANGGPVTAYGGLVDARAGRYCFRYFPPGEEDDDDDNGPTWDFCVSRDEIKKIADGTLSHLALWKCRNADCNCLYEGKDSYCTWCDDLPE
jgi:hypothetical protein